MSWLKLDMAQKKLLLIDNQGKVAGEVALQVHNAAAEEYKLQIPFKWFGGSDAPGAMVVLMEADGK